MNEDLISSSDGEGSVGEPDRVGDGVGSEPGSWFEKVASVDRPVNET